MVPQPFVRLLFSFTCGFERIHPLKSTGPTTAVVDSLVNEAAGVEGGELPLAFGLASEVNLYEVTI